MLQRTLVGVLVGIRNIPCKTLVKMLVRWCRANRSHRNILMAKQKNLVMLDRNPTKLYLVYLEWEPCDVT